MTTAERILNALVSVRGGVVTDRMLQGTTKNPASQVSILRGMGHQVERVRGLGYRLKKDTQ